MNSEILLIEKRTFNYDGKEYELYLIPENDRFGKVLSFYIARKGYGNLYYTVGIPLNNISQDLEDIIESNLLDWADLADMNTIE